ncbi:GNAT family N-acetyltransferase [uncultured Paludibaculum sp.]|uniref:GNAT family N-acetyltransferase n=1 Tax=uncultured Paludibaculum sp. TaxID=1765020 RepID=UPI00374D1B70
MFVVAESGDGVVGAAEMKRRPGAIHLNYIAVRPDYRRRHLGRQLLGAAIRCSGESSGEIVLDVFDENASAVTWYTKLGFTVGSRSDLVELVAPQRGASGSGYIAELAQADACHQRFGFSQFSVLTKRGRCPVGRLGEGWFRLCHPDGVTDPEVFAALRLLDPGRRIFGVLRDDQVPHEQVVRTVVRSSRMTADIRETVSRLEVWP